MLLTKQELEKTLTGKFGDSSLPVRFFQAPARINIIGEHVDYVGGLVLPAAIDFYVRVAIRKRDDKAICLYSTQFDSQEKFDTISPSISHAWANYVLGVVDEIQKSGGNFSGFDLVIDGNIPQGAGLSSSASLEVVTGFAISETFALNLSREKIALIGQLAENNFVGAKCGIMDQFIISVGKENNCILLNTTTLEYSYHSFSLEGYEWTLINSGVKHSLKDSGYNKRREECESALKKIRIKYPAIKNLYDPNEVSNLTDIPLTPEERRRVEHVVGEKKRTYEILSYLHNGDAKSTGRTLYDTHKSLSELFEVSCPETDYIVSFLKSSGITGARMIGGGFGGCVLVLSGKKELATIQESLIQSYRSKFAITPEFFGFRISDGVKEI